MAAPPPALATPPGAEPGRFDDPQQQQRQQLSPEEVKVLQECQSESFWRRSLPLSGLLGAAAHLAVQRGVLRPSPSYGAKPKVVLGIIVGYFAGKFSYATACSEKFLSQVRPAPPPPRPQWFRSLRNHQIGPFSWVHILKEQYFFFGCRYG